VSHERAEEAPGIQAIDAWLSGLLFAVAVSAFVVVASYAPVIGPVFKAIETEGIDAAMRARVLATPRAPVGDEAKPPAGFVFVDLDGTTCDWVEHSSWCFTRSPASPAAATRVAAEALSAGAAVVVIDVRLWDLPQSGMAEDREFSRLEAALAAHPTARVVALAPFRPGKAPGTGLLEASLLPPTLADGRVIFAPAYAWNADSVVRLYPATIEVDDGVGPSRAVGTVAYLAGRYLAADRDPAALAAVDCQAWAPTKRTGCPKTRRAHDAGSKIAEPAHGVHAPIPLYTLPSLTREVGQVEGPDAAAFRGLYDRYPSSSLMTADFSMAIQPKLLVDKVVIVGASANQAMDSHRTPLGRMAGAEMTLNMVRAYSADALLHEPSLSGKLAREATFAALGSLPFLAYWIATFHAAAWLAARRYGRWLSWAPGALLFPPTLLAAALLMILASFWRVGDSFLARSTWDLLTPLAALSLESLSHGGKLVSDTLERAVAKTRRRLTAAWRSRLAQRVDAQEEPAP